MITSKQRATLMGMAAKLPTIVQIGKFGVTEGVVAQIDDALERRELIKIGVLKSCEQPAKELLDSLAAAMQAEPVHAIGSKVILYRRSSTEGVEHIDFYGVKKEQKAAPQKAANPVAKGSKTVASKPYVPSKKSGVHKGKGSKKK